MPFLLKSELQYYNAYVHVNSLFLRSMRQKPECPSVCVQNLTGSEYCLLMLRLVSASLPPRLSAELALSYVRILSTTGGGCKNIIKEVVQLALSFAIASTYWLASLKMCVICLLGSLTPGSCNHLTMVPESSWVYYWSWAKQHLRHPTLPPLYLCPFGYGWKLKIL